MIRKILLCLLVGYAASAHYAWKPNVQYTYRVHGRTLSGLPEHDPTMSGVFMRADLVIVPKSDGILTAKIQDAKYSQVQMKFENGWDAEVPESKLQYQPLKISSAPFEIHIQGGIVRDIVVSKDIQNWEANIFKGIVSQLQLNTNGKHATESEFNNLPSRESNFGVYKVMEQTVTGEFETTYVMKPENEEAYPRIEERSNQSNDDDNQDIRITKSKNFTAHGVLVGYHYGFARLGDWEPNTNYMGSFMNRSSVSSAIISGNLHDYTIKSSNTSNIISFNPQFNNDKASIVASKMSIVFRSMQPGRTLEQPQNPINVGLFYQYNSADGNNKVEEAPKQRRVDDESEVYDRPAYNRLNSIRQQEYRMDESDLKLDQAPQHQMTPLSNGYFGKAIKHSEKVDIVREAEKLAKQIAQDFQNPNEMLEKATAQKFALLVRLTRTMDRKEMEKVAQALYTEEIQGEKTDSWKAYRDAVAQAGTGPALLTIQDWIKNKQISEEEAAEVVATMAEAARYPTSKYLKEFQQLVANAAEHKLETLNDTAAISFADLLYKVCVDSEISHQQYPFHVYGSFRTEQCQEIVKDYIKYLEGRLEKAVAQDDSHKTLVYIRALGNVGHIEIYKVFEKYLQQNAEKRAQTPEHQRISQFQRFSIVCAMNRFARMYPEATRQVMQKLYFSPSEEQEIRSLAVYMIGSTEPSAELLSAMAQYTEVDNDDYVNSAVKSAVRRLVAEEYEPAYEAERLLNDKQYGIQYPKTYFREYVNENMDIEYRHDIKSIGAVESILPKSLGHKLRVMLGGAKFHLALQRYMLSSLDELVNGYEKQTESYQHEVHQKKSALKDEQQYGSSNIASQLGMDIEEREQFEGLLRVSMGEAERVWAMDNYTIDNIPEFVKYWEQKLKGGRKVNLNKFLIKYEALLTAPTETGLPYVVNTETPTLFRLNGKVQGESLPEISNGEFLRKPESVKVNAQLRAIVSKVSSGSVRFYTPFDHQGYASGYNKEMQVYLPINADVKVDLVSQEVSATIKAIEPEQDTKLFQYRTIPYNVRHDLLDIKPVALKSHYKILMQQTPNVRITPIGHDTIGMTFHIRRESDSYQMSLNQFLQAIQHKGFQAIENILFNSEILYSKTEFAYQGTKSANQEVKARFNWLNKHFEHEQGSAPTNEELLNLPGQQQERTKQVAQKAAAGIKSVKATAGDMEWTFAGQKEVKLQAGFAYARGPVDKQSRFLAYIKKETKTGDLKPWYMSIVQSGETPNTNGLDFQYAMKFNPTTKTQARIAFGSDKNQLAKLEINGKFQKTEDRVEYLNELPEAKECRQQMQQGQYARSACANMTAKANLLNDVDIRVKHTGLDKMSKQLVQKVFDLMRPCRNNEFEFEGFGNQKEGEIDLKLRFSPDLRSANYSAEGTWATPLKHSCQNIDINRWERQLFVLHPVFKVATRLEAEAFKIDSYRPICSIDKNSASTFDGKEYEASLSNEWTLMFQHLPQFANQSGHSDLSYRKQYQIREYVALVRKEENGKAVKMSLRVPRTEQKLVHVELKPTGQSNPKVKVFVDNQEVKYDQHQSKDFYQRAIRVYGLPNDEVKVEIDNAFYFIADGRSVKLSTESFRFNNATRGLCGNHNFMESDDLILPNGEIETNNKRFVQAYTLGQNGQKSHQKHGDSKQEQQIFLEVARFEEIRQLDDIHQQKQGGNHHSCTEHRQQHIQRQGQDCFTVQQYPACKPGCKKQGEITKTLSFVCFEQSKGQQYRQEYNQAGYVDVENKGGNAETLRHQLPTECRY